MPNQDDESFYEGEEVQAIFWPAGGVVEVGKNGCTKITVIMEYGQMARVPWFAVWDDHKITYKYNGAHLEGVKL